MSNKDKLKKLLLASSAITILGGASATFATIREARLELPGPQFAEDKQSESVSEEKELKAQETKPAGEKNKLAQKTEQKAQETEQVVQKTEPAAENNELTSENNELKAQETEQVGENNEQAGEENKLAQKTEQKAQETEQVVQKTKPAGEKNKLKARKTKSLGENNEQAGEENKLAQKTEQKAQETEQVVQKTEPAAENNELTSENNELKAQETEQVVQKTEPAAENNEPTSENNELKAQETEQVVQKTKPAGEKNKLKARKTKSLGENNEQAGEENKLAQKTEQKAQETEQVVQKTEPAAENNELTSENNELKARKTKSPGEENKSKAQNNEQVGENNKLTGEDKMYEGLGAEEILEILEKDPEPASEENKLKAQNNEQAVGNQDWMEKKPEQLPMIDLANPRCLNGNNPLLYGQSIKVISDADVIIPSKLDGFAIPEFDLGDMTKDRNIYMKGRIRNLFIGNIYSMDKEGIDEKAKVRLQFEAHQEQFLTLTGGYDEEPRVNIPDVNSINYDAILDIDFGGGNGIRKLIVNTIGKGSGVTTLGGTDTTITAREGENRLEFVTDTRYIGRSADLSNVKLIFTPFNPNKGVKFELVGNKEATLNSKTFNQSLIGSIALGKQDIFQTTSSDRPYDVTIAADQSISGAGTFIVDATLKTIYVKAANPETSTIGRSAEDRLGTLLLKSTKTDIRIYPRIFADRIVVSELKESEGEILFAQGFDTESLDLSPMVNFSRNIITEGDTTVKDIRFGAIDSIFVVGGGKTLTITKGTSSITGEHGTIQMSSGSKLVAPKGAFGINGFLIGHEPDETFTLSGSGLFSPIQMYDDTTISLADRVTIKAAQTTGELGGAVVLAPMDDNGGGKGTILFAANSEPTIIGDIGSTALPLRSLKLDDNAHATIKPNDLIYVKSIIFNGDGARLTIDTGSTVGGTVRLAGIDAITNLNDKNVDIIFKGGNSLITVKDPDQVRLALNPLQIIKGGNATVTVDMDKLAALYCLKLGDVATEDKFKSIAIYNGQAMVTADSLVTVLLGGEALVTYRHNNSYQMAPKLDIRLYDNNMGTVQLEGNVLLNKANINIKSRDERSEAKLGTLIISHSIDRTEDTDKVSTLTLGEGVDLSNINRIMLEQDDTHNIILGGGNFQLNSIGIDVNNQPRGGALKTLTLSKDTREVLLDQGARINSLTLANGGRVVLSNGPFVIPSIKNAKNGDESTVVLQADNVRDGIKIIAGIGDNGVTGVGDNGVTGRIDTVILKGQDKIINFDSGSIFANQLRFEDDTTMMLNTSSVKIGIREIVAAKKGTGNLQIRGEFDVNNSQNSDTYIKSFVAIDGASFKLYGDGAKLESAAAMSEEVYNCFTIYSAFTNEEDCVGSIVAYGSGTISGEIGREYAYKQVIFAGNSDYRVTAAANSKIFSIDGKVTLTSSMAGTIDLRSDRGSLVVTDNAFVKGDVGTSNAKQGRLILIGSSKEAIGEIGTDQLPLYSVMITGEISTDQLSLYSVMITNVRDNSGSVGSRNISNIYADIIEVTNAKLVVDDNKGLFASNALILDDVTLDAGDKTITLGTEKGRLILKNNLQINSGPNNIPVTIAADSINYSELKSIVTTIEYKSFDQLLTTSDKDDTSPIQIISFAENSQISEKDRKAIYKLIKLADNQSDSPYFTHKIQKGKLLQKIDLSNFASNISKLSKDIYNEAAINKLAEMISGLEYSKLSQSARETIRGLLADGDEAAVEVLKSLAPQSTVRSAVEGIETALNNLSMGSVIPTGSVDPITVSSGDSELGISMFGQGIIATGGSNATTNPYTLSSYAATAGIQIRGEGVSGGVAAVYGSTDLNYTKDLSFNLIKVDDKGKTKSSLTSVANDPTKVTSMGAIGNLVYDYDIIYADINISALQHDIKASTVRMNNISNIQKVTADTNAKSFSANAVLGLNVSLISDDSAILAPFAGLYYSQVWQDSYEESAQGPAKLTYKAHSSNSLSALVGAKLSGELFVNDSFDVKGELRTKVSIPVMQNAEKTTFSLVGLGDTIDLPPTKSEDKYSINLGGGFSVNTGIVTVGLGANYNMSTTNVFGGYLRVGLSF